ncbi:hypothetical protein AAVH_25239 [Aphelenchoides avenae]|nr:hypothetical protein AAVH_25239 [Aphelenchus avenae]
MEKSPSMSTEKKPCQTFVKMHQKIGTIEQELRQLKAMLPNKRCRHKEQRDKVRRENEKLRAKIERYKRRLAKKAAKERVKKEDDCGSKPTTDKACGSRKRKAIDDASDVFVCVKNEDDFDLKPTLDEAEASKKIRETGGVPGLDLLASTALLDEATLKLEKASSELRDDESTSDGRSSSADEDLIEHDEDDKCACKYCRRPGNHKLLKWIQCDRCDRWYHCVCVWGMNEVRPVAEYTCARCMCEARLADFHEPRNVGVNLEILEIAILREWLTIVAKTEYAVFRTMFRTAVIVVCIRLPSAYAQMSSSLAGVQPTVPCPLNEDFQQCVRCEGSCTAPLQPLLCPMSMPCVSKCTCSFLHVRNGADGRCIPLGDCGLVGGMMGGLGGALNGAVSGAVQGYNGAAAAAIAGQNRCQSEMFAMGAFGAILQLIS